jgi:S1-C subfamily serine protease
MMDLNQALLDPTEMEVNGEISARATGFQKVIQHDSVLAPNQCGGPVIDIYGNAIGINIARAGRVSSYAIPAKIAAPAIADMLNSADAKPTSNSSNVVQAARPTPPTNSFGLPASVPGSISIETLKPEIVAPKAVTRP